MTQIQITPRAEAQLEEIFAHGVERWGWDEAQLYSDAIIDTFERIVARTLVWRPVPAEVGVEGFRCRSGRHHIYWRSATDGVTIVAILHDRMDQAGRLREDID